MSVSLSPALPLMTILSILICRPSVMLNTTRTSASANFSMFGVIWTSK